jgi:leader peptidase (prepilin peptidase) / N-methyltransferase
MMLDQVLTVPLVGAGAISGSFLNVVIHRVPAKESIVLPPSHCPRCETHLAPADLVPIVSWLVLGGKCRYCAAPISRRYPFVEALTAALFAVIGVRVGWSPELPAYLVLVGFLVALGAIDIDTTTLPRRLIYAGSATGTVMLGVASAVLGEWHRMRWAAIGAAGVYVAFRIIHAAARGGFGYGDVRLGAMLGGYLGWLGLSYVPVGIFAGFVLGSIVGVALMVGAKADRRTALPFGPFLAGGALLTIAAGPSFVDAVWRF